MNSNIEDISKTLKFHLGNQYFPINSSLFLIPTQYHLSLTYRKYTEYILLLPKYLKYL